VPILILKARRQENIPNFQFRKIAASVFYKKEVDLFFWSFVPPVTPCPCCVRRNWRYDLLFLLEIEGV